jgi:hypothetical protein
VALRACFYIARRRPDPGGERQIFAAIVNDEVHLCGSRGKLSRRTDIRLIFGHGTSAASRAVKTPTVDKIETAFKRPFPVPDVKMGTEVKVMIEATSAGWRFKLGIIIVALMFAIWLLIPLAAATHASAGTIAAITGGIFIANKVLLLVAVAIMGKSGFRELKKLLFGYVAGLAPNPIVGPVRYRIGLAMFCLPLVSGILTPFVDAFWPGLRPNSWPLQLLGNIMLIASLFVLGGNFWDKLRALFVRTATVVDARDLDAKV